MALFQEIASKYPTLKRKLTIAHIELTPEQYVRKNIISALSLTVVLAFGIFLFTAGLGLPIWVVPVSAIVVFFLFFELFMHVVDVKIRKLAKEIDRDVLFAGRFLLIKLNSGKPLMNAIIDASNSYGVANRYFKEIVRDI